MGRGAERLKEKLDRFRYTFAGFCTDMGTELGAAEFKCRDVTDLLPAWFDKFPVSLDVVADVADVAEAEEGNSDLRLDVADDEECNIDMQMDVMEGDEASEQASPASPAPITSCWQAYHDMCTSYLEANTDHAFLPNALTVPGMLHINNNMLKEVAAELHSWKRFFGLLKIIKLLWQDGRRERYIQFCVRTSTMPQFADELEALLLGSLYTERFLAKCASS